MNKALKEYKLIDGRNFTDNRHEKLLRKIIKLAGKDGWEYSLATKKGKTFCVVESEQKHPKGKITEESVKIEFIWRK